MARDRDSQLRAVPGFVPWSREGLSLDLMARDRPAATDLLLALLRRRPAEDTGVSMRGDTALWRSWLALTPL